MIRQQRELLKQTFTARELPSESTSRTDRLAETQQEILVAAEEFATGLRQRVGEVPALDLAIVEMQSAIDALRIGALDAGQQAEEAALSELIQARQNLRKILKMSNGGQSSQCRTFDRQQQQKLRPPELDRKPKDPTQQEQLSKACESLEQLAQQQQQWSQQACPNPQSPSSSPSSSSSSSDSPRQPALDPATRQQLSQQQQQAIDQAKKIDQQLRDSRRGGESAEPRMEQAAQAMRDALEQLDAEHTQDAAQAARQAADTLRDLAEHLQGLNEPEFAQRLAAAANAAGQLARDQRALNDSANDIRENENGSAGNPSSSPTSSGISPDEAADSQRRLTQRSEQLDELSARLAAESREQAAEIQRLVQAAREANPIAEITELMRASEQDFTDGRNARGIESANLAARSLEQLADDLRGVHQRLTQPDLEQLLAAEQAAAELLRKMLESRSAGERALAHTQLDELERTLDPLAAGDRRLAEAQDAMHGRSTSVPPATADAEGKAGGIGGKNNEVDIANDPRFGESDRVMVRGLRQVTNVLQTMIQESILDRALLAPDDSVPPGYQNMVEEYYRALSEDLR